MAEFDLGVDIPTVVAMLPLNNVKDKGEQIQASCPSGRHADRHPSWSINKSTGQYYCFSCGFSGNLYTLIRHITGQSLYQFLKISDPTSFVFQQDTQTAFPRRKVIKELQVTKGGFISPYRNDDAMAEINRRGMNDQFVEYFEVQYAKFALINDDSYFIERLCLPIVSNKKVISIEGRLVKKDDRFKKVLYPKGSSVDTLFNIDKLDFNKPLYLVEGSMDTVKIWQSISKNVTCPFGVALGNNQKRLIAEAKHLIVIPDPDEGGQRFLSAIDEIVEKEYYIVSLPEGKDPDKCSYPELEKAITNRMESVAYFHEKHKLFRSKEIQW